MIIAIQNLILSRYALFPHLCLMIFVYVLALIRVLHSKLWACIMDLFFYKTQIVYTMWLEFHLMNIILWRNLIILRFLIGVPEFFTNIFFNLFSLPFLIVIVYVFSWFLGVSLDASLTVLFSDSGFNPVFCSLHL